jgi:monoamine oxidase
MWIILDKWSILVQITEGGGRGGGRSATATLCGRARFGEGGWTGKNIHAHVILLDGLEFVLFTDYY